mgnify:CR=1 FL=1
MKKAMREKKTYEKSERELKGELMATDVASKSCGRQEPQARTTGKNGGGQERHKQN